MLPQVFGGYIFFHPPSGQFFIDRDSRELGEKPFPRAIPQTQFHAIESKLADVSTSTAKGALGGLCIRLCSASRESRRTGLVLRQPAEFINGGWMPRNKKASISGLTCPDLGRPSIRRPCSRKK